MALFGPAGLADSFKAMGYKKSIQVADYLSKFGLTAFEYQAGRGVKIGTDAATQLGNVLADKNIQVSIHAPYFISMSSVEEEKRLNSVNYILQSAQALNAMGGRRIIFFKLHTSTEFDKANRCTVGNDSGSRAVLGFCNEDILGTIVIRHGET